MLGSPLDPWLSPQFLGPGQTRYLLGWTNLGTDEQFNQVDRVEPSITFSAADALPAETIKVDKVTVRPDQYKIRLEATGTATNTGSEEIDPGTVAIVLFDDAGVPIEWLDDSSLVMGLLPGQKKGFSTNLAFVPASLASKVNSITVFAYELAF